MTASLAAPPSSQKIHVHRLANGLTLVAEEMDWLESAAFALLTPAGCAFEPANKLGLSSLLCEMVQRGCGERDSRQFVNDIENLGADVSASTSVSHTSFGGAMPKESLHAVLSIYADLVQRPHLPEDQLEDARLSCLQEVRAMEDDLSQKVMLELRRRFYAEPWGRSSPGTVATLESITQADVRQCFEQGYIASGSILSVAGNIDWPSLRDHVEQVFGGWRAGAKPVVQESPPQRGVHHIQHESSQTLVGLAIEGIPYSHPDYFQLRGAIGVLSDGMSSRLFTEVREKRGYVYGVYATCHSLRDRGAVLAFAATTPEFGQDTLDVTWGELKRLYAGVTVEELNRLKGKIKRALIIQQESSPSRASSMAMDWFYLERIRTKEDLAAQIDALTPASISAWLTAHPPRNLTVVSLGPKPLQVDVPAS